MAHPVSKPICFKQGDLRVWIIPLREDNYSYFVSTKDDPHGFVVDPSEGPPLLSFFAEHNLRPKYILLTHHHDDHIAGAELLRDQFSAKLVGAASERGRLPKLDVEVADDGPLRLDIGPEKFFRFTIIPCPGHTFHHIAFYLNDWHMLFSGDVLFGLGCGRVFEGTMKEMYDTLQRLVHLLDASSFDVSVFCGHEYTRMNLTVWQKAGLINSKDEIAVEIAQNPNPSTMPLSLRREKQWNPLLIADAAAFEARRLLRNSF